jgi:hypothetical protein
MRVEVYYNLHKKTFSVRALSGPNKGRVVMHTNEIALKDAKFVVRESGRKKVLEEKRKNVHAFVRGDMVDGISFDNAGTATYNPYRYSSFVNTETKFPVYQASSVLMVNSDAPCILYA